MSEAGDTVPQLIGELAERCQSAADGRTVLPVRTLLAAYGAVRRGRHVLARIQRDLRSAGLASRLSADEPPTVDDELEVRLRVQPAAPAAVEGQLIARLMPGAPRWTPLVIIEYAGRQCAGVIIDRRGLVAGSALLVADAVAWGARATVTVRSEGRNGLQAAGRVAATDRDSDVMLLWLATDETLPAFEAAPLLDEHPQQATLISDLAAGRLTMETAAVQIARTLGGGRRLRCSAPVAAEALGGPLLVNGAVVGIVNRRGTQHSYAVPIAAIGLLRERAELQRHYLLRALRCSHCHAWLSGSDAVCGNCGRPADTAACDVCGGEQPITQLHECCATCGRVLNGDEDGLTQLACAECQIELDDVQLRCEICIGQAAY